ncbi:MAG: hypothetical protein AAF639_26855 [Chloroflexota bacterium]
MNQLTTNQQRTKQRVNDEMQSSHLKSDGSVSAIIQTPAHYISGVYKMELKYPATQHTQIASRRPQDAGFYYLARCYENSSDWSIYLRRPLFIADRVFLHSQASGETSLAESGAIQEEVLTVIIPENSDPGYLWLQNQRQGTSINLIGPFGTPFTLPPNRKNLLIITELAMANLYRSVIEQCLDRGGRVSMIVHVEYQHHQDVAPEIDQPIYQGFVTQLPVAVELQLIHNEDKSHLKTHQQIWETIWKPNLSTFLQWADLVYASTDAYLYPLLAAEIRQQRLRLEAGFAQAFVETDLICGVGACLGCTIQLADGSLTRACVHGPIFDLTQLG